MNHDMRITTVWEKPSLDENGEIIPGLFTISRPMLFSEVESQIRAVLKATQLPEDMARTDTCDRSPALDMIEWLSMATPRDATDLVPVGDVWVSVVTGTCEGHQIKMSVFRHGEFQGHLGSVKILCGEAIADAIGKVLRKAFENGYYGIDLDPEHGGETFNDQEWPAYFPHGEGVEAKKHAGAK